MRINERTALSTKKVLLVPYSERHVPDYHQWMLDPDLRAATASEPLSLDEEYAMQRSWRSDHDKLTFIISHPLEDRQLRSICSVRAGHDDRPQLMIGDINLFLFFPDSEETEGEVARLEGSLVGEVELMIAKADLRRKGYGRAALLAFLEYVLNHWQEIAAEYASPGKREAKMEGEVPALLLSFLRVKVQVTNVGSIRLFENVGFVRTAEEPNYFGEIELRWLPNLEGLRAMKGWESVALLTYEEK